MFPLTFASDLHSILFVLNFGLTHRGCTFPLAFVNTSQDWLILQISLASLRVAHMASHWRMTVDAAKFKTPSQRGSPYQPHQACLSVAQTVSRSEAWSGYQLPARSWLCTVTLQFFSRPSLECSGTSCQYVLTCREIPGSLSVLCNFDCHSEPSSSRACHQTTQKPIFWAILLPC
jgi:hypothetical protein